MTPSVTLFCRTYRGDAHWLREMIRSYRRHVQGFEAFIVHCDPKDRAAIAPIVGNTATLVSSEPWCENPYINQQCIKLACDFWVRTPYVLFIDSDMVFNMPATPDMFFREAKPHLLVTPYDTPGFEATVPWRSTVEELMKERVEMECMRGPRLIHVTEAFPSLRNYLMQLHGVSDVLPWLCRFPRLSEFNLVGAYVYKFCQDRYSFSDTTKCPLPINPIMQFWSKGGITDEVRRRIDAALA